MSNHVGFASAVVVGQSLLQDLVRVFHFGGLIPASIPGTAALPLSGLQAPPVSAEYDLFLETPRLRLTPASIRLELRLAGPLTLRPPEGDPTTAQIVVEAVALVAPRVRDENGRIILGFDADALVVREFSVRQVGGPALPAPALELLNGAKLNVEGELRSRLGSIPPLFPEVFGQLDTILGVLGLRMGRREHGLLALRMLPGAIAIAMDVEGTGRESAFRTDGSAKDLVDFTGGASLAAAVHPELVLLLLIASQGIAIAQARVQARVAINAISFALEESNLLVRINLTHGGDTVGVQMRLRPLVSGSRVMVDMYDVQAVELPWWGYLIHVVAAALVTPLVSLPFLTRITEMVVHTIGRTVERSIEEPLSNDSTIAFTLPGTAAPRCTLHTSRVQLGTSGLDAAMTFRVDWGAPTRILGPTGMGPRTLGPATYRLAIGAGDVHPADPTARIRWEVRRLDNHSVVTTQDRPWREPGSGEVTFDPTPMPNTHFRVHCRLYRALAEETVELFSGSLELRVGDRLDRTRPYVRWSHTVFVPQVEVTSANGERVPRVVDHQFVRRTSDIHRTAIPGRCRFADAFSPRVLPAPDPRAPESPCLEYLDELPFPVSELAANRQQLCDYCFFGGPDKTVPLI